MIPNVVIINERKVNALADVLHIEVQTVISSEREVDESGSISCQVRYIHILTNTSLKSMNHLLRLRYGLATSLKTSPETVQRFLKDRQISIDIDNRVIIQTDNEPNAESSRGKCPAMFCTLDKYFRIYALING